VPKKWFDSEVSAEAMVKLLSPANLAMLEHYQAPQTGLGARTGSADWT
jgi:hypothetical protein